MFRKVVALLVVLAFAAPAAAGPITGSIAKAVKDVARQERATTEGPNPYLWPAVGVMSAGTAVAAWGFLSYTYTITTSCVDSDCIRTTDSNRGTTIGVVGLGIVGAGVVLLLVGNGRRPAADISFGPRSVKITRTFTF